MDFDQAFIHLVGIEGNFVDDPSDSGGATKYGITERVARKHNYQGHMRDLPLDLAKRIYFVDYWVPAGCDRIQPNYPELAYELFDSVVNIGIATPVKWLQRALNAFNNTGTLYADLLVDGQFGPSTERALAAFYSIRKQEGEKILLAAMNSQQGSFYLGLVEQRQKDEKFVYGWFKNRVVA